MLNCPSWLIDKIRSNWTCSLDNYLFSLYFKKVVLILNFKVRLYNLWRSIASSMLKKRKKISNIEFRNLFKLSIPMIDYVWTTLKESYPERFKPTYLLWTLFFLKTTSTNFQEISFILGTTPKTLKLHVSVLLHSLKKLLPEVTFT
jgi:hypothetical protein